MSSKPRAVITDFIADELKPEREVLDGVAEVSAANAFNEDELAGKVEDAAVIMVYHHISISRTTIDRLQQCKLIVRCGVGVDNVDLAYARELNIPVANVPDYGTEDIADSAIGMLLTLTRGIHYLNSRLRASLGDWHFSQAAPLHRLRGTTVGIIGLGCIGTATALRCKAMGMNVAFYDPYLADGYDKALGIRRIESLEELLPLSNVLSLHCPLTDQTRKMIDAKAIARMPRGAYLVNTARGGIVDIDAIPDAIASGQLAGAGIDVLPQEPPSDDNKLLRAWRDPNHPAHHRVILNPHSAFYSEQGLVDMRTKGSQACKRAILGQPLRNVVN